MIFGNQDDQQATNAPVDNSYVVGAASVAGAANDTSLPTPANLEGPEVSTAPDYEPSTVPTPPSPMSTGAIDDDVVTPAVTSSDDSVSAASDDVPSVAPVLKPVQSSDLLTLKQQALNELSPLIGHLDQTPEEKFRTTMMLIQSTDNQDLLKDAYTAAQQITEDNARAQALLDVVNEINYFTQHAEEEK